MQTTVDQRSPGAGVAKTALDWESLGRYVRIRTLDAVAMHFAATACGMPTLASGDLLNPGTRPGERGHGTPDRERLS